MQFKNILSFDVKWDYRTVSLFVFLLLIPNLLGMINLSTPLGFNIHFFQVAVFVAAIIYGPKGGALSGLFGSAYSAVMMNNPYIAVGNMILGFFAGLFVRYGISTILAVWLAFVVQLFWLVPTDYFLMNLPAQFMLWLLVALAVSNTIWAIVAHYSAKQIRRLL